MPKQPFALQTIDSQSADLFAGCDFHSASMRFLALYGGIQRVLRLLSRLRSLGACVNDLAYSGVMQVELRANFGQGVPIVDMRGSDALIPLGASQLL